MLASVVYFVRAAVRRAANHLVHREAAAAVNGILHVRDLRQLVFGGGADWRGAAPLADLLVVHLLRQADGV